MRDITSYKHQQKRNPLEKDINAGFRTARGITKSRKNFINRKIREKIKNAKFKPGDIVYVLWGYDAHSEFEIVDIVRPTEWDHELEYKIKGKGFFYEFTTSALESVLAKDRINITDAKYKIGDLVKYSFNNIENYVVEEVFKYAEGTIIFYKINCVNRNHKLYSTEESLSNYREPIRIYSDMDPYGEEDWNEN